MIIEYQIVNVYSLSVRGLASDKRLGEGSPPGQC